MKPQADLESALQPWLDEIKAVPTRDAQRARRTRAQFLSQAVSASALQRHKRWNFKFGKERFTMNVLLSILVITGLLFGGGVTVQAAQNDLPNEPLYGLKTFSEDASLQWQNTPETQINRLMSLTQVRVQEMERLTDEGVPVPDQVRTRLEQHLQQALQVCSTLEDAALEQTLLRVRDQLRQQDRDMQQLQTHATAAEMPALNQVREMLQLRLQLVDDGLLNHEMFRNAVRNGFRYGQTDQATPPAQTQNGNGSQYGQPTAMPGGPNPDAGGPNTGAGGPNMNPGGPNSNVICTATPIGPNTNPGGPNTNPGGPNTDSGSNHNGSDSGGGGNATGGSGSGAGGSSTGGSGSGSGGGGSSGSGGNGSGGNGP